MRNWNPRTWERLLSSGWREKGGIRTFNKPGSIVCSTFNFLSRAGAASAVRLCVLRAAPPASGGARRSLYGPEIPPASRHRGGLTARFLSRSRPANNEPWGNRRRPAGGWSPHTGVGCLAPVLRCWRSRRGPAPRGLQNSRGNSAPKQDALRCHEIFYRYFATPRHLHK
jgi:hypothetical protein